MGDDKPSADVKEKIAEKLIEKVVDKGVDKVMEHIEKATADKAAVASVSAICGQTYAFNVVASNEVNEWFWWNVVEDELKTGDATHNPEVERAANAAFKAKIADLTEPECPEDCPSKTIEIRNRKVKFERRIDKSGSLWTVVYWKCTISCYLVWRCQ